MGTGFPAVLARLALGVLILEAVAAPRPASAESWPWLSTEWLVVCEAGAQQSLPADECDDTGTTGVAAVTRSELEAASAWLKQLEFRAPDIESEGGDYVARISDQENTSDPGKPRSIGLYRPSESRIYMTSDYFFAIGEGETQQAADIDLALNLRQMATMVHELFHGVQHSYHQGETYTNRDRDWIWEGTADAIELAWIRRETPDEQPLSTVRDFDHPLHIPREREDTYGTDRFWYHVGGILGSTDNVQYLHDLLEQDLADHRGLEGIDQGLKDFDPEGLYTLYPEFIARKATHPFYVEERQAHSLSLSGQREHLDAAVLIRPVAITWIDITANLAEGELATLEIRADDDDDLAGDDPALHLIVGGDRYDVVDPDFSAGRNVFRETLVGGADPETFNVRVANVAKRAELSKERTFWFRARLEPITWLADVGLGPYAGSHRGNQGAAVVDAEGRLQSIVLRADADASPYAQVNLVQTPTPPPTGEGSYPLSQFDHVSVAFSRTANLHSDTAQRFAVANEGGSVALILNRWTESQLSGEINGVFIHNAYPATPGYDHPAREEDARGNVTIRFSVPICDLAVRSRAECTGPGAFRQ